MNIAISGKSGFVGTNLSVFLTQSGHRIFPLGRQMFSESGNKELVSTLSQCDVVINLAGAPINKRWTRSYKEELYKSRILVTRKIVQAIKEIPKKPQLFISTSAVGYYPTDGSFNEDDEEPGSGFLSELCYKWEKEAMKCPKETRRVITRFGIVLSPSGGALRPMLSLAKMKVAGIIASGNQPFPWISITDLCRAMSFIIQTPFICGVINLVAPQIVNQREFIRYISKYRHTWITVTIPGFIFRLLYGEAASFLTSGQSVIPQKLPAAGFKFAQPTLDDFWKYHTCSSIPTYSSL